MYVGDISQCKRCGCFCNHEGLDFSSACRFKCNDCGNDKIERHNYITSKDGTEKCSKCGRSEINWTIRNAYLKELEIQNRKNQEDRIMKAAMVGEDKFRCECCKEVKPVNELTKEYHRPLCQKCVLQKLRKCGSHLVYEKIDGYDRTVTCVKCGHEEFWRDAEHQGKLLSDCPCI